MADTKIEWADMVWNPTLGCDKVSDGCKFCYAIVQAWIKQHNPNPKISTAYKGLVERRPDGSLNWTGVVRCLPGRLEQPLQWRQPRRIFANSMSDLFHEDVPEHFLDRVFAVMALTGRHIYQVLTKRPERMRSYVSAPDTATRIGKYMTAGLIVGHSGSIDPDGATMADWYRGGVPWPLPNVWLGVSVEDQRAADERIPLLLQTPAAVRFLSCEPLIGPVSFRWAKWVPFKQHDATWHLEGLHGIDWIITGGESGPSARSCDPDWVRSIRDECNEYAAGTGRRVALFHKQWGGRTHAAGGRELDGRTWDEFPRGRVASEAVR